ASEHMPTRWAYVRPRYIACQAGARAFPQLMSAAVREGRSFSSAFAVMPRESGASSTPCRGLVLLRIGRGVLDHPHSRMMTLAQVAVAPALPLQNRPCRRLVRDQAVDQ